MEMQPQVPKPFPEVKWSKQEKDEKAASRTKEWEWQWALYEQEFNEVAENGNIEEMHTIWTRIAVATIKHATDTKWHGHYKTADKRAQTATSVWKEVQAKADNTATATTNQMRRHAIFRARLAELKTQQARSIKKPPDTAAKQNEEAARQDKFAQP